MKIKDFIKDQLPVIIFYIILMTFINIFIYSCNTFQFYQSEFVYMNVVSSVFLLIFLSIRYINKRLYYRNITPLLKEDSEDIVSRLPIPKTYEQKINNDMISKLNSSYNAKLFENDQYKRDNQDFITSWVHEIKIPISVMKLITDSPSGKTKDEIINAFEDETKKIENYIEQILYFSRSDNFFRDYFICETNIEKVVNSVIKNNAKIFITKHIKLELNNIDFNVLSDSKWLFFIINQILSNSLKYTSDNGTIKIYGKFSDNSKKLIIEDNGTGIMPEDQSRIFDKGFTGYNGRKNYNSTGIGLYLCKKLSEKLGHELSIKSEYGKYTKVIITFKKLLDFYDI